MTTATAKTLAHVTSTILNALESGHASASQIDGAMRTKYERPPDDDPLLTYADGWRAALGLARLVSAETVAQIINDESESAGL